MEDLLLELVLGYIDGRMPQSYYLPRKRWFAIREEYMKVTGLLPFQGEVPYSFKIMGVDIAPMDMLEKAEMFFEAPRPYDYTMGLDGQVRRKW